MGVMPVKFLRDCVMKQKRHQIDIGEFEAPSVVRSVILGSYGEDRKELTVKTTYGIKCSPTVEFLVVSGRPSVEKNWFGCLPDAIRDYNELP